jgi:branched-chain amino acid aminotransferase
MLEIRNLTTEPEATEGVDPRTIEFGRDNSPNFFVMDYRDGQWRNARIEPVQPFVLHPAANVLHYAQTIFEGLKAYRQPSGSIALFRPHLNATRFHRSARRMCIPAVAEEDFLDAVNALVKNERHLVPAEPGCLYIRPSIIGVEPSVGLKSSNAFTFFVLTYPSGPYFGHAGEGAGSIDVLVSTSVTRACQGGMGNVKAGANYAGTLAILERAKELGCAQVLFLDAVEHRGVEEMGGMNLILLQNGALRTPPLSETILDGVTRDSVLALAEDFGLGVEEELISIDELVAGLRDGSITEAIACGTAAVTTGIKTFRFEDGSVVPVGTVCPGPVTSQLYERLVGIQYGRLPDPHNWVRPVA